MINKMDEGTNLAKVLWYYNLLPSTHLQKYKIICPFHDDVNPSVVVNLNSGHWYCFGCNKSGNAKEFVKQMELKRHKVNDLKIQQKYMRILKSDKCSDIHIYASQRSPDPPKKLLYAQAYDYYHGLSPVKWGEQEALTDDILFCKEYMEQRGFSPDTLRKCGAKYTYNDSYSLVFPMLDNGKFKGWVCRTTDKEIEAKRKYLYNKGFSRATTLVGDYGKQDYVFVVEGYMDRLKFIQNGVDNVVAILGWKMSQQQEEKLKKAGVKYIISALDNDECGRKGTKYLETRFKTFRFKYLKGIKDPGDMTKELFNKMFSKTIKLFEKERQKWES